MGELAGSKPKRTGDMDGRPQQGRFVQVGRVMGRQPPGPLDPDMAGAVNHDLADFGIFQSALQPR